MTELGGLLDALSFPFASAESRTYWGFLVLSALIAIGFGVVRGAGWRAVWGLLPEGALTSTSLRLDVQLLLFRRILRFVGVLPQLTLAFVLAASLVRLLDGTVGRPAVQLPAAVVGIGYTLVLFVAWDLSRYLLHRLLHTVPALWEIHQVHHSAQVLTPLTFHRVHPLEDLLNDLRGALVTGLVAGVAFWLFRAEAQQITLLGGHALGVGFTAVFGNLRHSHVAMGFGPHWERWFVSPAQHQLHHSRDHHGVNYGTWLACWDRLGGSLRVSQPGEVLRYGLDSANHDDDLLSAVWGPVAALGRRVPRAWAAGLLLGVFAHPAAAQAEDEEEAEGEEDQPHETIVVTDEQGKPRTVGSAHKVDQETLELYEADDIHRVIARVPGIYTRTEDGFGLRPNIGMRGGNSDRSSKITLLEDGVPLSPAPYAAPAAYYFPLTTRMVGVEVFKGPAAIQQGPQTIGGAVNLLTRSIPRENDGELDLSLGLYETVKAHGWGGSSGDNWGVLVEGAHLSSGGFKELDGGGPTGFSRQDMMVKARVGQRHKGLVLKLGVGREVSNETYLGLTLDDFADSPYRRYVASAKDRMQWTHWQASITGRTPLGPQFDLRATAYANQLDRAWRKFNGFAAGVDTHALLLNPDSGQSAVYVAILRGEEDSTNAEQQLRIGTNDRTFTNGGVQGVLEHKAFGTDWSSEAQLGVRAHYDHAVRNHTEDLFDMTGGALVRTDAPTETTLDSVTDAKALAAYVHEDLGFKAVHLVPGTRIEAIQTRAGDSASGPQDPETRTIVLPGVGAYGDVVDWLQLFAGISRGFSPVAPGQDPEVLPETAWTSEAGVRVAPGQTYLEVVGFRSDYENLSGTCTISGGCSPDQLDQQFNGGAVTVQGLESVARYELPLPFGGSLHASASYTLTTSEFETGFVSGFSQFGTVEVGDSLPYVPVHQGGGELSLRHDKGSIGIAASAQSEMRDVAGQGEIAETERIPGYMVADVSGSYSITRWIEVYTSLTNVTGTVAYASLRPYGARPIAPFTARLGVKVTPARR